ncbi:MAG: hypothetical protein SVK54_07540 [candidate division WOR-3 bacterium]|nr:hypothetical protein [candidate division WOR-3 bacterium]
MNKDMIKVVERIKEEYPNLYVDIEYHENDDLYEIWHNDESLLEDEEFHRFIGALVYDLYKKDTFNFFMDTIWIKQQN